MEPLCLWDKAASRFTSLSVNTRWSNFISVISTIIKQIFYIHINWKDIWLKTQKLYIDSNHHEMLLWENCTRFRVYKRGGQYPRLVYYIWTTDPICFPQKGINAFLSNRMIDNNDSMRQWAALLRNSIVYHMKSITVSNSHKAITQICVLAKKNCPAKPLPDRCDGNSWETQKPTCALVHVILCAAWVCMGWGIFDLLSSNKCLNLTIWVNCRNLASLWHYDTESPKGKMQLSIPFHNKQACR